MNSILTPSLIFFLLNACIAGPASANEPVAPSIPTVVPNAPKAGDADFATPSPGARHDQKVAAIKSGKYDLVLIGDSITQCLEDGGEWAPLNATWEKHYVPRNAINLGYSAYRTENILWNLQNGELDFTQSPKVFMLLIGTNNTDDQHFKSVHTAEQLFAGTKAIVDLIRQRHPTSKIVIRRPFPSGTVGDQTPYARKYNRSLKAIGELRRAGELTVQLADGKQVFWSDVGHVFLRPDGTINPDLMPDLIHPNAAGAEAAAQAIEPLLSSLLRDKPVMDSQSNPALVPVSRADGSYDWMARHRAILASKETHPEIVFIGDSITHHIGGVPKTTGGFANPLGATFWGDVCTAERPGLNLGFGADWTQHVLWRIDHGELDRLAPKHVVLMIGTNNVLHGSGNAPQIIAGVRACLIRIRAKTPLAKIILMGVLPCGNPATNPTRLLAAEVNKGLEPLAKEAKCDYLDLSAGFIDSQGNIPKELMPDGVHPSAAGYKIWSADLVSLLKAHGAEEKN